MVRCKSDFEAAFRQLFSDSFLHDVNWDGRCGKCALDDKQFFKDIVYS